MIKTIKKGKVSEDSLAEMLFCCNKIQTSM